ncbi:imelysin family protein [Christiangramia sabulilitoris]|uniref:Imelysin family protein n=1 Tax=Christiangramia sabulilitoris TaxID=2583991 RepID=A0A550I3P5_9FLAO|nr:imelysin family protein [Christiangramia sabulilitoris]TRO65448.1 imelysin family protein [Christiangramia sabulilitoris]
MIRISKFLLIVTLLFTACSKEDDGNVNNGNETDSFDRGAMLENWADNIIVPAFDNFKSSTQQLEDLTTTFTSDPTEENLVALRSQYESSYLEFQTVAMFDIGKAEELGFRRFLNTYPLAAAEVDNKIASGSYNLELPSSFKEQGFPALDYLINGIGDNNAEIVAKYSSENYRNYLLDVSKRINSLTEKVNTSWQGDYRDTFVSNTSSSSTGSVDKLTNKYIMYFETFLRSGKIGYPSGVFTGTPSPINAEAYYSNDLSKELYLKAVQSTVDFFNGRSFNGGQAGSSFKQYLEFLDRGDLAEDITAQFAAVKSQATKLDSSLKNQVQTNNTLMLGAYDELQKIVVLLKLDMVQALSISINYVDSDGD